VKNILRTIAVSLSAVLLGGILVAGAQPAAAEASSITEFNAGNIITDGDMFNFTTMTAGSIQSFLNSKVAACDATSAAPCLKDYRADVTAFAGIHGSTDRGCENDIAAAAGQSAAQIIYTVARACQVNPQVLIVTLQKEQGLVTKTSVTDLVYRKAMGYGCPDTSTCDSAYYGFFNQVYWAARAFQSYVRFPASFNYSIGVEEIKLNPKTACGTKTVRIENAATAALYNYTPYTPNAAAVAGGTGDVGDECSSYGNRNFWRYFYQWFGSEAGTDPYFIRNADSKQIYLIIDGKRRPVESKHEMRLLSNYTGIKYTLPSLDGDIVSDIGRGSVEVLLPGSVVKSSKSSKSLWFIDGLGTKRPISSGQAKELTGSSAAQVVSKKTIAGYATGKGSAKLGLQVNGKYFIADNGIIRQIRATDVAHYKKRFGFGSYDISTLKALDRGVSIGRLIKNDGKYYLVRDGAKVKISTAKYKSLARSLGKKAQPVSDYFAKTIPTKK
jgi:hypothetical protein